MPDAVATPAKVAPSVPRLFPGGTVACIATGRSLRQADVDYLRGRVDAVIVINDAFRLAPWADVLYACDDKWWSWHYRAGAKDFAGLKYAATPRASRWPGVQVLRNDGEQGLCLDPTGVRTGKNSGYQAINLSVHLGASRVVLLGYDMQGPHFFGKHPDKSSPPFPLCLRLWPTIVEPLKDAGVEVVNCTRDTALTVFPTMRLEEALP